MKGLGIMNCNDQLFIFSFSYHRVIYESSVKTLNEILDL